MGAALLAACGSSTPSSNTQNPPPTSTATWHKDIAPLVQEKCGGCHVEGGIAPFPLQTYAQVNAARISIRAAVMARIMPPWPASNDCTDYQYNRSLTSEQLNLLTGWVDAGAAEGDPSEAPASTPPPPSGLSRVDLELKMAEGYTPQKKPDDYRCFILDWPETDVRYVTGYTVTPGVGALVHHVIAFAAAPADVAQYQALDDNEAGPGYTCFGGPGGDSGRARWLGAWVPGSAGAEFPAGTGLRMEPGSKVILQVHYNLSSAAPSLDQTKVSFKLDNSVEKVAYVMPWANPQWVTGAQPMTIPAGGTDVIHRFAYDPTPFLSSITNGLYQNGKAITVYGAALHMHTHGTHAKTEIWRGGSASNKDCLLDIPKWDFHWQSNYLFSQPKTLQPGDVLALECHWDNTGANAKDIAWGEGTGDEMCLGTFFITQ